MNDKKKTNTKRIRRQQPRKDSASKRVNLDNERESKFKKQLSREFSREDSNDIRWYTKNQVLLDGAARIPFSTISGVSVISDTASTQVTPPGVMALVYSPNFVSNTPVVMQAFNSTYSNIVHANSRNQSYDATDLAILMYAGFEIFAGIASGERVYGLMKSFAEPNYYTPKALVEAAGFDYNDLVANYSHMYSDLNQLIAQSRQIWIPNTMPIVERRVWMNSSVYTDSESAKAQYYLYKQKYFYKYSANTSSSGGMLQAIPDSDKKLKWNQYVGFIQSMIDALIPDQDRGIIYGDILKAYGYERLFALNDIALDYTTPITYNREVLWQIENATIVNANVVQVEQETTQGRLWQKYAGDSAIASMAANWNSTTLKLLTPQTAILNFHQNEQPTVEQIAVATRMTSLGSKMAIQSVFDATEKQWKESSTERVLYPSTCGTEMLTDVLVYYYQLNTASKLMDLKTQKLNYMGYGSTVAVNVINAYIPFDWAPALYTFKNVSTAAFDSTGVVQHPGTEQVLTEFDNWAPVDQSVLERLHNAILFSLYDIPIMK